MKKAAVITMHRIYNYGSVLQAYATQKIIEDAGLNCEIIDYISPYRVKHKIFFDYPPKLKGKKVSKFFYFIAKVPSFILKDISFGTFIRRYLHLSNRRYITNKDLLSNPPEADIYITGSDQVWNSKYNRGIDESYYLNFAKPGANKYAFVSSFGADTVSNEEKQNIYSLLKDYKAISVREDSALDIIKSAGLDGIVLIDPTLQLDGDIWRKLASKRLVKNKYLLLFLLYNEDNGATDYALAIAERLSLKVVKLSWELKKPEGIDYLFTHRKPQDFLSLFSNADFVVTNSFHGVAFSINFNRQFVFVPRNEFNSRITSLLRLLELEDRIYYSCSGSSLESKVIDYAQVNKILNEERSKAKAFVSYILEGET